MEGWWRERGMNGGMVEGERDVWRNGWRERGMNGGMVEGKRDEWRDGGGREG